MNELTFINVVDAEIFRSIYVARYELKIKVDFYFKTRVIDFEDRYFCHVMELNIQIDHSAEDNCS